MFFSLLLSCNDTEDICYSCDEELNKWAIENTQRIAKMSRKDISNYPLSKQRAAFRVMSPEKKESIWMDKIDNLKTIYKDKDDLDIINYVTNVIKEFDLYDNSLSDQKYLDIDESLDKLLEKAGWTKLEKIYAFGRIDDMINTSNREFIEGDPDYGDGKDCHCRWGAWCTGTDNCDTKSKCEDTMAGCGFLWAQSCTGYCQEDSDNP